MLFIISYVTKSLLTLIYLFIDCPIKRVQVTKTLYVP
jgi:hypothetical protein